MFWANFRRQGMFASPDKVYSVSISWNFILLSVTYNFGLGKWAKIERNDGKLLRVKSVKQYQGRNKVYFFITDPVFLPQILIPDHKNVENFNPWSQKHWEFWSLIPKTFTILIPDSTKTLLIPIPSVVIPDPGAVIPDLIYLVTTLQYARIVWASLISSLEVARYECLPRRFSLSWNTLCWRRLYNEC